jgi:hypothetical protein
LSFSPEIHRSFVNPEIHYHVHKSLPVVGIFSRAGKERYWVRFPRGESGNNEAAT